MVYYGEKRTFSKCIKDGRYEKVSFTNGFSLTQYDLEKESGLLDKLMYRRIDSRFASKAAKETNQLYIYQRPTIPFKIACEKNGVSRQ